MTYELTGLQEAMIETGFHNEPKPGRDKLVLAAHKCRGKMEWEVAIMWDFGTPADPAPWYILQATGHRIYPYYACGFPHGLVSDVPGPPEGHRDFYDLTREAKPPRPTPKPRATIADL